MGQTVLRDILAAGGLLVGDLPETKAREAGLWLWAVLSVGLAVLLVFVALIAVRYHRSRRRREEPSDMTDAWAEAGRRVQAPKEPSDGDDDSQYEG